MPRHRRRRREKGFQSGARDERVKAVVGKVHGAVQQRQERGIRRAEVFLRLRDRRCLATPRLSCLLLCRL